jgi:serralysin
MATQPTAQDQYMLELLNRARLNPQAEANRLLGGNLNEGITTGPMITATPKQALAFNSSLLTAAQNHSQWMLDNNTFSHTGVGGSLSYTQLGIPPIPGRIVTAGYPSYSIAGENLSWSGTTGTPNITSSVSQQEDGLFVDTGVSGRGHRKNILEESYREVGISAKTGIFTAGGTPYNAVMITQDFATDSNSNAFLTGVLYTDGVTNDDFYTVGEGLGGITINAIGNGQTFSATSMTAGGYSLRLAPGTYSVSFSGDFNNDGIADTSTARSVTIGSQNVKVDFASDTYVPPVATPTEGDDVLSGTTGADNINALGGNDRVSGLAGNDTLNGGAGNDTLDGGDDNDVLYAGSGNNVLNGGTGNDTLFSSPTGVDTLTGGTGDDVYEIHNSLDQIVEISGEGNDTVWTDVSYTLAANVETMYLVGSINGTGSAGDNTIVGYGAGNNVIDGGAGNDNLYGGDGNDVLYAGSGNNVLNGGAGNDTLFTSTTSLDTLTGGTGDDVYEIHNSLDQIVEISGEGTDTVWTDTSYTLAANVETMYLIGSINGTGNAGDNTIVGYGVGNNVIDGGAGNDNLYGGDGNDVLYAGSGNNVLNGGAGNDTLFTSANSLDVLTGGIGDDVYEIHNSLDQIVEISGEGTDTVWTDVSYTLAANVETMYLVGSIDGTGSSGNNTIVGYGAGNNVINGGAGNDLLYGGAGNDTFVFDSSSFLASVISGLDTIGDFTATQDKIQLSKAAFTALSSSVGTLSAYNSTALTGDFVTVTNATQATFAASAAKILYNSDTGALLYNADGNIAGFGNGGQFAGLTAGLNLTNSDFKVVT